MFRCLSTILHTFREQRTPDNCLALLAVTMEDLYQVADEVCLLDFKFCDIWQICFRKTTGYDLVFRKALTYSLLG